MKKNIKSTEKTIGFKLRGLENTRIESLSDGVFAIAIGLLLISSSPPQTFIELVEFSKEFIPFGITIAVLMWIWYQHYLFFIRFGLRDPKTTVLNTMVLFLILFYVYPLKFLISVLVKLYQSLILGNNDLLQELFTKTISPQDTPKLMYMYGFGAAAIFIVMALLNARALTKKTELSLNKIEVQLTKNTIWINIASGVIPLVSGIIAVLKLFGNATFIVSGFIYMSYMIVMPIVSKYGNKKIDLLLKKDD